MTWIFFIFLCQTYTELNCDGMQTLGLDLKKVKRTFPVLFGKN